jgi:hypothetical protein
MRVCMKAFSIRYDICWYDLKQLNFLKKEKIKDRSVKSQILFYSFTRAKPPSSDTLHLRCRTFLLLSPLVTVYFRNDLVIDCLFRDKFKNRFCNDLFFTKDA